MLAVREQVVLPTVENSVRRSCHDNAVGGRCSGPGESSKEYRDLEDARKTTQQSRRAACLQDELVREDKHARFREEIGIYIFGLDNRQDFAIDQIKHCLPDFGGDSLESRWFGAALKGIGRWTEPYF
jgi:hypothetical protein